VGLKGWDDFIVRDADGRISTIPTVPLDKQYLAPTTVSLNGNGLIPDARITGKIKWYTKPVVFDGDPASPDNMCWITLDQHIQTVKWWNQMYRTVAQK